MEAVTAVAGLPDSTLVLLRDLHLFLQVPNPVLVRALKDALVAAGVAASRVQTSGKKAAATRTRSAEVIIAP